MIKNIKNNPLISVLMPVYNAGPFLNQAIDSILNQTFADFEFIIINDGSTDQTESIVLSYTDSRIRYFNNPVNLGIVKTLNRGIDLAKGKYLARMDADDIALPKRFEKQYLLMESNPEIAVCGSQITLINNANIKTEQAPVPILDKNIKILLIFSNVFTHSAAFFRTEIIKKFKYNTDYPYGEDYYLFAQIAIKNQVANHPEKLMLYRIHEQNTTSTRGEQMKQFHLKVIDFQLSNLLQEKNDPSFPGLLYTFLTANFRQHNISVYKNIINTLLIANKANPIYDHQLLKEMLHQYWFKILLQIGGRNAFLNYISGPIYNHAVTFKQLRRMFKTSLKSLFQRI